MRSWSRTPARDHRRAEAERQPRRVDGRRGAQDRPAEEPGVAARAKLVGRERADLLRRAELDAGLDRLVGRSELRLARGDVERRRGAVPGVDALALAPLADPAHAALGGAHDLERALVADAVAEDRQVVPERRDEAAVPPARPVAREARPRARRRRASGSSGFSCHAVQSPRYPPPTTTTSAVVSPSSGAVASTGPASSSHQP